MDPVRAQQPVIFQYSLNKYNYTYMIYCYVSSGEFRSIEGANKSLSEASLVWRDNWVTFLDGLLQLNMLRHPHDGVSLVTHIRNMKINVNYHQNVVKSSFVSDYKVLLKAAVINNSDITRYTFIFYLYFNPPIKYCHLLKKCNFNVF